MGAIRRPFLCAAVIAAWAGATASSTAVVPPLGPPHVEITQVELDLRGDPFLVANLSPDGSLALPVWWRCRPGASCQRVRSGNLLRPGATPAGTVFEARATYQNRTTSEQTPAWAGRVRSSLPPRLMGAPAVGRRVRPVAGTWTGGWTGQAAEEVLRVEACPHGRDRSGCVTLSARGREFPGLGAPPLITQAQRGRYLFAVDQRLPRNRFIHLIRYGAPASVPAVRLGATVTRSAPSGPVPQVR